MATKQIAVLNATGGNTRSVTISPAFHRYPTSDNKPTDMPMPAASRAIRSVRWARIPATANPSETSALAVKGDMRPRNTL